MKRMSKRALRRASARVFSRKHFRAWLTPASRRARIRPYSPSGTIPFAARVLAPDLARPVDDLPDDEIEDGLIKANAYAAGFTVQLGTIDDLLGSGARGNEIFHLTIGAVTYEIALREDPISYELLPDPVEFAIPPTFLGGANPWDNVTFDMKWHVEYGKGGSTDNGLPAKLTVDTTRPGPGGSFLGALKFPEDILKNGITSSTFSGRDYIEATVPGYNGEKAGDWLRPYINGEIDKDNTHFAVVPWEDAGEITIRFYRDFIEAQGDGELTFQNDVFPREENPSQLSQPVRISVSLEDALDELAEPTVPAYDDDPVGSRLIVEADARGPVIVHIPSIPEITDVDSIKILWGDTVTAGPVPVEDPTNIDIEVEYAAVLAAWLEKNAAADDIGVPIDVRYSVYGEEGNLRGTSDPHPVEVNLHVAGGIVDPDPGTEPNENLLPLSTLADSGAVNRITLADNGKAATAKVPKLSRQEDADGDFLPAFGAKDVIRIIAQDDTELTAHTVIEEDLEVPDGDLDIVIEWDDLAGLPGGTIPFAYWIDTTLASGGTNTTKSPITSVIIEDASALPGGGTLPHVIMPERGLPPDDEDNVRLDHIVNTVAIGFPIDIENFDPETDTIRLSMPMFMDRHKPAETPVPGYGDVVGENRFVLLPPHTVLPPESGDVAEPPVDEPAFTTRPPITVPHILFRLEPDRLPELHGDHSYHTHVIWTIENSVGVGTSPVDEPLKVTFETRGEVKDPSPASASTGVQSTTVGAEDGSDAEFRHDLAWLLRRLKNLLS